MLSSSKHVRKGLARVVFERLPMTCYVHCQTYEVFKTS